MLWHINDTTGITESLFINRPVRQEHMYPQRARKTKGRCRHAIACQAWGRQHISPAPNNAGSISAKRFGLRCAAMPPPKSAIDKLRHKLAQPNEWATTLRLPQGAGKRMGARNSGADQARHFRHARSLL